MKADMIEVEGVVTEALPNVHSLREVAHELHPGSGR